MLELVATAVVGLAIAWFSVRFVRAHNARADIAPLADGDGTPIAVRSLEWRGGFGGMSTNGISPRLTIADSGLRFKIFRWREWPFAAIERIDVAASLSGSAVILTARDGTLHATLADRAAVRTFLRGLPPTLALTAKAVALRDTG